VPLIARWPAKIKPRVSDQIFSLVDFPATLAALAGQKMPKGVAPDSIDLSRVLSGKTDKNVRDHTMLHGISDTLALRQDNWKYIPANATGKASGIGNGADPSEARFAASRIPEPLLFDLSNDPNETTNVIQENPKQAAELKKRFEAVKAGKYK
jgi:arylsulfatase A-like enzyme